MTEPTIRNLWVLQEEGAQLAVIEQQLATSEHRFQAIATVELAQTQWEKLLAGQLVRPDLILLDWQFGSGLAPKLLAQLKDSFSLRRIPIIVLSRDRKAVLEVYAARGNCYVICPEDLDQLTGTIRQIEEFWLGIVTLPCE
ncbi:MAG: response regulator [Cyanobacteria bacterium P01_H01_bin.15]